MARPGPQTMAKRQREQKRMEKKRAKREKMLLRRAQKKENAGEPGLGEEPDGSLEGPDSEPEEMPGSDSRNP